MKYYVRHVKPADLEHDEVVALRRLSYKREGYLFYDITECINYDVGVVIIVEDDTKIIGWSLLVPTRRPKGATFQGLVTSYGMRKCLYEAQFYVRSSHRRKGIGGILMREVQKYGRPWVYPSSTNAHFFMKYPVSCEDCYRKSYLNGKYWKSAAR